LIDLNHILLFIALVSPLILLVRIARLRNPRNHGWRVAAIIVLGGCIVAWFLAPPVAGFVGGALWCLLLLLPSLAERRIDDLLLSQDFAGARRVAIVRRILHPWEDTPQRPALLRCLELAANGRLDLALDRLAAERARPTPAGRFAMALTFALTENWTGLVEWCRRDLSLTTNPAVYRLYLQALGETGQADDLIYDLASQIESGEPHSTVSSPFDYHLALALAFAGKTAGLVRLFSQRLPQLPLDRRQFWLGTSELAGGKSETGRFRLEKLRRETTDVALRRAIDRRLDAGTIFGCLSSASEVVLARLVQDFLGETTAQPRPQGAPAVWGLILLNGAMFVLEWLLGGVTNDRTLRLLGALDPAAVVVRHEYWRLLTALFLHYGALHLAFNLYALYLLGPALERVIGSLKFLISYLIAGLGSSVGVVLLRMFNLTNANLLVGASGGVMGVIGVSAGLLLRHRASPLAGRRLRNIIVIVALQTAFDLTTPQVSLAAHLSGFITGVVIGTVLASQRGSPLF
jgi:rhomboid protease GluP